VEVTVGAFLNALGILLGALIGLVRRQPFSRRHQLFFRNALGALNFFLGVRLIYLGIGGSFLSCLKQVFIGFLAIILGFWAGKFFSLQKLSNRIGRLAGNAIVITQKSGMKSWTDGFSACAMLFCAEPIGLVGGVAEGLSGFFYLFVVKALMDALAMADLIKIFRWPSALSAIPVFLFFSTVSMATQLYIKSHLTAPQLDAVNVAAGMITCVVTIVIFEIRKVELANYLPALAMAPLLVKMFS
jgi:uncharacterized protein